MSKRTRRLVDDRTRIYRQSRLEIKFVLEKAIGETAAEILNSRAEALEDPDGRASWEVQSTYLDDTRMTMIRAAHADPASCIRVRTREYPRVGHSPPSRIWLEVKRREGDRTEKTRFPIQRENLESVLAWDVERARDEKLGDTALQAVQRLRELCEGQPLVPVAEVSYRRSAFVFAPSGDADEGCRVTLDHDLRYRLPRLTDSFDHRDPTACQDAHYLEVKGAPAPAWLLAALEEPHPENFSKFVLVTGDYLEYEQLLRRAERLGDGAGPDASSPPSSDAAAHD